MKNLSALFILFYLFSFHASIAQEFEPLIYKGYAVDSSGTVLNGSYDFRLMVLDSKLVDRILWSRIFLNVNVDNGYYDINVAERGDEVRNLFSRDSDLIFRSVILDLGYSIEQYMSGNFQKISLEDNKIFAENYPVAESNVQIPELPYLPLKFICPLENISVEGDSRIELKIINYGNESTVIRIQLYSGRLEPKTIEFSLEGKRVRNEIINDIIPLRLSKRGFIEVRTRSDSFIITGDYITDVNDSTMIKTHLNWRSIK